jgi:type II secretory pathway component PulC
MMHIKLLGKQEQTKLKIIRGGGNNKDNGHDQWIETKKTIQRINETKSMLLDLGHTLRGEHIWEEWG